MTRGLGVAPGTWSLLGALNQELPQEWPQTNKQSGDGVNTQTEMGLWGRDRGERLGVSAGPPPSPEPHPTSHPDPTCQVPLPAAPVLMAEQEHQLVLLARDPGGVSGLMRERGERE